jgi:hypothetical protein
MRRPRPIHLLVSVALAWLALCIPATVGAQEGTPTATVDLATGLGFPVGIGLTRFGEVTVHDLAEGPAVIRVEHEELAPGEQIEMRQTDGPEFSTVIVGEVVVVDSLGFRVTVEAGSEFLLHARFGYQLSNEGTVPASIMRLTITGDAATPEAAAGSDRVESRLEILVEEEVRLSSPSATLFLGRMSWDPDVATGQYWQEGIWGIIPESGEVTLSLHSPSGLKRETPLRRPMLVPERSLHEEANIGPGVATALVFAVVDAGGALVRIGEPLP